MKIAIIVVVCTILALIIGFKLGESDYIFTGVVFGGVVLYLVKVIFARGVRIDSWAVFLLVSGYFLGGKAFALLSPGGDIYVGEIVLAFAFVALVLRILYDRHIRFYPGNPLFIFMLLLLGYGFIQMVYGYRIYRFDALRDTATIYYSLFFFIGYSQYNHARTFRYYTRYLPFSALVGAVVFGLLWIAGGERDAIIQKLSIGNFSFLTLSIDVGLPMSLATSAYLYIKAREPSFFIKIATMLLSIFTIVAVATSIKSVCYLAFFVSVIAMIKYGNTGYLFLVLCTIIISSVILFAYYSSGTEKYKDSLFNAVLGEFSSFSLASSSDEEISVGQQTVDWRFFWWKLIAKNTMRDNPIFGLGFGTDITTEFIEDYYFTKIDPNTNDRSRTRYPHCILFTIFGRLGFLGLALFLPIFIIFCIEALRSIKYYKLVEDKAGYAFLWIYIVAALVNSLFQATFEPPYAAIPFWVIMGIAYRYNEEIRAEIALAKQPVEATEELELPHGAKPLNA